MGEIRCQLGKQVTDIPDSRFFVVPGVEKISKIIS